MIVKENLETEMWKTKLMSCQEVNFYLLPNTQSHACLSYRNSHTDAHPAISVEGGAILQYGASSFPPTHV